MLVSSCPLRASRLLRIIRSLGIILLSPGIPLIPDNPLIPVIPLSPGIPPPLKKAAISPPNTGKHFKQLWAMALGGNELIDASRQFAGVAG